MKALRNCVLAGVAFTAFLVWQPTPSAQSGATVDPSLYSGMRWRSVGPARGGRSLAVGGSEARPLEYWFGATGGGAWKTTDGGSNWAPMTDGKINTSSIGSLAVCQSNPDVVYIGGGETQLRGNIIQGDGVYKTTDGGVKWDHLTDLRDSQAIARLRVHPTNCDIVYAAVLGQIYNDHPQRGIFKSADGGKTWRRTLFRDEKTGGVDLSIDPKNPNVIFASLWEAHRTPWSMSSGGPGSGLFKSTDGGDTLDRDHQEPRTAGRPVGQGRRVGVGRGRQSRLHADRERSRRRPVCVRRCRRVVEADQRQPQHAAARVLLHARQRRSDGQGHRLRPQRAVLPSPPTAARPPPTSACRTATTTTCGFRSTDNKRMVQANDGGANVTVNGGQTWTDQDIPTGQFYNVFTTRHVPYHICGAQQDNSTACVGSQANPGAGEGSLPPIFYAVGGGESGYIAADPNDLNVFFAGSYGGYLSRLDRETGQQRAVNIYPNNPMGYSSIDIKERFQWTYPIVFSPLDPKALYASSQHVWRTTNDGQSWERISPNLTRSDPKTMQASGGPITKDQTGVETYAVVFTLAPSRQDVNTIWAGSDDGWVHVTRDGGKNWERITPPDLPEFARISLIEASPHQNGVAYLAANRYQMGDRKPYVYKTADFGKTWQKIVTGIPDTDFPRVIREDIKRRGLLYVGTEHGIYVSFNDGASWQSLKLEPADDAGPRHRLGGARPRDRHARPRLLRARQHRRAAPGHAGADQQRAVRVRAVQPDARPRPQRHLRLLPEQGRVGSEDRIPRRAGHRAAHVHRHAEGGQAPRPPATTIRSLAAAPPRVSTAQGINRFTWDMRYEGATVFPGMIMWAAQPQRGPAAPTGKYTVRITANGETKTRDFTIALDPRLVADGITEADLLEQFKLSLRVRDKVSEANQAVIDIRNVREQINRAPAEGVGPPQGRDPEARRRGAGAADRGGGRGLPGPQPQRPGSAELSDQVEQQDRGAGRRDRKRRQQADQPERRGVQRTVGAARCGAGQDEGDAGQATAAAQRRA